MLLNKFSGVLYTGYGFYEWKKVQGALKTNTHDLKKWDSLFSVIDKDNSGFIELDELVKIQLDKSGVTFSRRELLALLNAADEDHDGKISKVEWHHLAKHLNERESKH